MSIYVETAYSAFTSNVVHRTLFPYPIVSSLHAARISIAFQSNVRKTNNHRALSWGQYLVGFLIMAWSASIQMHFLLSIPPPHIYSIHPWINYLSIHLALTAIFQVFPSVLSPRVLDTLFFLPDAIIRTASVSFAVELVHNHPDPRLSNSLFLSLLIAAIASSGGSMTAATLGVWTPNWTFSTPVFLRKDATVLSTLDIWGGSLVGCVYGLLLASHPVYKSLLGMLSLSVVDKQQQVGPVVTSLGAKAVSVVVLTILFAWRVLETHWRPTPPKPNGKSD